MPRVNFYLLPQQHESARGRFACRLAEKLFRSGLPVQLHTADETEARELDKLLWTCPEEGFVPHQLMSSPSPSSPAVLISWGDSGVKYSNVLNLSDSIPAGAEHAETIAEFVLGDENSKALSRQLWNQYKSAGYDLQHHQI